MLAHRSRPSAGSKVVQDRVETIFFLREGEGGEGDREEKEREKEREIEGERDRETIILVKAHPL